MSTLASLLLGASVTVLTTALLRPKPREPARQLQFVKNKRVPRTLH